MLLQPACKTGDELTVLADKEVKKIGVFSDSLKRTRQLKALVKSAGAEPVALTHLHDPVLRSCSYLLLDRTECLAAGDLLELCRQIPVIGLFLKPGERLIRHQDLQGWVLCPELDMCRSLTHTLAAVIRNIGVKSTPIVPWGSFVAGWTKNGDRTLMDFLDQTNTRLSFGYNKIIEVKRGLADWLGNPAVELNQGGVFSDGNQLGVWVSGFCHDPLAVSTKWQLDPSSLQGHVILDKSGQISLVMHIPLVFDDQNKSLDRAFIKEAS